jgi:hypothetical protein
VGAEPGNTRNILLDGWEATKGEKMTDILREAERIIALDNERITYANRVAKIAVGGDGAWFRLKDHIPEMMVCIRGLYAHIAERYGVEIE